MYATKLQQGVLLKESFHLSTRVAGSKLIQPGLNLAQPGFKAGQIVNTDSKIHIVRRTRNALIGIGI